MIKPNSLNHLAISTADMKKQIAFFSDVLGLELIALYWMHGAENTFHGFMKLGDESIAFVFKEENKSIETVMGQTHPGNGLEKSAPGTMQHLALNVDNYEDMIAMRDRIRSKGIHVLGPLDHGFCSSIYFAGPENLSLEIATFSTASTPLDDKGTWIDPEVVARAGISEDELKSYMAPADYKNEGGSVPQPAYNPEAPNMTLPLEVMETPDDVIWENMSETTAPSPNGYGT